MNNDRNKKLIITILLQNLIASENLPYEFLKVIYEKIVKEISDT